MNHADKRLAAGSDIASTQMLANGPELAAQIRALGTEISRALFLQTGALYAPLHERAPKDDVRVQRDLAYGPHERHRLDLYQPRAAAAPVPVLVFAHGGGFVAGDKADVANVGRWFARHGVLTLAVNYRYAPDSTWPGGVDDLIRVLDWVRDAVDVYGGDPGAVFLAGNSAGANHVGGYVFFRKDRIAQDGVRGAIMISAPSANLTDHDLDPARDALYYGGTPEERAAQSMVNHLDDLALPLLLAVAENDIPLAHSAAIQLAEGLFARTGRLPNIVTALGHNHVSVVEHIGTADETLGPVMLEFILQTLALRDG